MTSPSVTYTFSNGTTADAGQVNQNFTDLIAAMTDGTKTFSIDALTVAGTALLNGAVTLGNASGDDITFTGSLASAIPVKTNSAFDLGDSTHAMRVIYANKIQGGTTAGCELVGRTDGVAPSTGMIGQITGTDLGGTGGKAYSTQTTTAPTTTGTLVISQTLKKGTYLISVTGYAQKANNTTADYSWHYMSVGGAIGNAMYTSTSIIGLDQLPVSTSFPVVISTDDTVVGLVVFMLVNNSPAASWRMSSIRIA